MFLFSMSSLFVLFWFDPPPSKVSSISVSYSIRTLWCFALCIHPLILCIFVVVFVPMFPPRWSVWLTDDVALASAVPTKSFHFDRHDRCWLPTLTIVLRPFWPGRRPHQVLFILIYTTGSWCGWRGIFRLALAMRSCNWGGLEDRVRRRRRRVFGGDTAGVIYNRRRAVACFVVCYFFWWGSAAQRCRKVVINC